MPRSQLLLMQRLCRLAICKRHHWCNKLLWVNRSAWKWVPSEGPGILLLRHQSLSRACNFRVAADPQRSLTPVKNDPPSLWHNYLGIYHKGPLNGPFSIRKDEISWGGELAKFKCNCSHCVALRWMVGLSHYSPSTDMLPRVIWQRVKINHNQDGRHHCRSESVALGAVRVWEQIRALAHWSTGREKKEDPQKRKQKKSNKNSMSPRMLFPSAMLLRELMFLWVPNRSERRQMAGYRCRRGGRLWI